MPWPVLDTFSDANGTLLAGTGVSVDGSGYTTRLSDSGSQLRAGSGSLSAFGAYEVNSGAVYRKTSGAGTARMLYVDNPGVFQTDQVTATFKCFTNIQPYISLTVHTFYDLRYYFQTVGSFTAGNWYIIDTATSNAAPLSTGILTGSASYSQSNPFTFSGGGTLNTVSYKLTGTTPGVSPGMVLEVIVNGSTLPWTFSFTSAFNPTNMYFIGWAIDGVASPTTGIHLDSFTYGAAISAATAAEITGPAVVAPGITSPASFGERGLVGTVDNAGVFRLTFTPYGSVLGSNATFTLSDGASGTFGGSGVVGNVLTVPAGQTTAIFTYTAASVGNRTITATPGGAASAFATPSLSVVVSSKVIITDGDSLTDYRSATIPVDYLRWVPLLQRRLGATAAVYNFAVSGQAVSNQISDFASEIQPRIQAAIAAGATVYFVQYGAGNSINPVSVANSGFSTTQVGQNVAGLVSSICTSAKNLNARVIVLTYPKRKNSAGNAAGFAQWQGALNEANFNAAIDACNAAIRSAWPTYASTIVDWAATAENESPQYTTGRLEDGTHPYLSNAGVSHDRASVNNEIAALVFGAYRSLELGGGSSSGGGGSFVFGS